MLLLFVCDDLLQRKNGSLKYMAGYGFVIDWNYWSFGPSN